MTCTGDFFSRNGLTYSNIKRAKTPEELYIAIKERAKLMGDVLETFRGFFSEMD